MKKLKFILCFVILLPALVLFSACGKNKNNNSSGGDEAPAQETKLTTKQILEFAFDSFDSSSKKEVDGVSVYSAVLGDNYVYKSYDNFVYADMFMLKKISSIETLEENKWMSGMRVEFEEKESYVNKVSKFFVSNVEEDGVSTITIYVIFEISDFPIDENEKSFDMYKYQIDYNHETQDVKVEANIEKSRNRVASEGQDSLSKYYIIKYSSEELIVTTFEREIEIDNIMLINQESIKNYHYLKFNFETNSALEINGFGGSGAIPSESREYFFAQITDSKNSAEFVKSATIQKSDVEDLTQVLFSVANANKISDIVD